MKQIIRFLDSKTSEEIARLEMAQDISWDDANAMADILSRSLGIDLCLDINDA